MGKNMKETHPCPPHDRDLGFPQHASTSESTMANTHTQLRSKYPAKGEYETAFDFSKGVYAGEEVVVRAGSAHARNIEGAGGWEMGGYQFVIGTCFCLRRFS